jgi:hypothetical protein
MERSDYLSLLNRAILNIDPNTPEARSKIYDRARHALLNELKPQHLAAGLLGLALATASCAQALAQAQIGGALPSLSTPGILPAPLNPQLPTPISPLTAPPFPLAAPAPTPQTAAPVAVPAQPAR